ncbi:MAG: nuclease-related domain-containing protein [Dehalococcoidales bacterium]
MIIKDVDSINSSDKFTKAGHNAEKTMAFYLSREFKYSKDVLIINGIRLEMDNDVAQIDHLVIHDYGMIIVESKSVLGEIKINEFGEWQRTDFNIGLASPVEQAKRQASFLRNYLIESGLKPTKELTNILFGRNTYEKIPIDILVAISDTGVIDRPSDIKNDNVFKADLIPSEINNIIKEYKKLDSVLIISSKPFPVKLDFDTKNELARFLCSRHTAKGSIPTKNIEAKRSLPISKARTGIYCFNCNSDDLSIMYGKHGYYFKCNKCDKTKSIKERCPGCNALLRLNKRKNEFYIQCKICNTSRLFFKNRNSVS